MARGFDAEHMARDSSQDQSRDLAFLASIVLLVGTGLAALWSASSGYAVSLGKPASYFFLRQVRYLAPSLALFSLCALLPLETIRSKMVPITLIALCSLLLPLVPGIGDNRNGASRWIDFRVTTFQPSEIWKPVSVLYLAHMMDRLGKDSESGIGGLVPPFLLVASGCILIFLQNDLSTAAIAALAAMALFLVGGASVSFFIGIGAVALPLAALSILTSDFRLRRILSFLYPAYEPHGQGYQILGSIRAIQSGGFFGKGIGLGTLKVGSVPEVQTDFIFAAWTEETGFLGVIVFFALWGLFAWKCYRNAFREEEGFRSYLGFGLITLLLMEVLVNVAMASGAIPASGIPLPLFSSGGSSFLATFGIMGLLVNLSRPAAAANRPGRFDEEAGRAGPSPAGRNRAEAPRGGDYV